MIICFFMQSISQYKFIMLERLNKNNYYINEKSLKISIVLYNIEFVTTVMIFMVYISMLCHSLLF